MSMQFTVTGLDETIAQIGRMIHSAPTVKQRVYLEAANFMADQMRANVHVITGNLKNSIGVQITLNEAIVTVGAEYAVYENARVGGIQGPHDFADRAIAATLTMFPQIAMSAYGQWTSSLGVF